MAQHRHPCIIRSLLKSQHRPPAFNHHRRIMRGREVETLRLVASLCLTVRKYRPEGPVSKTAIQATLNSILKK